MRLSKPARCVVTSHGVAAAGRQPKTLGAEANGPLCNTWITKWATASARPGRVRGEPGSAVLAKALVYYAGNLTTLGWSMIVDATAVNLRDCSTHDCGRAAFRLKSLTSTVGPPPGNKGNRSPAVAISDFTASAAPAWKSRCSSATGCAGAQSSGSSPFGGRSRMHSRSRSCSRLHHSALDFAWQTYSTSSFGVLGMSPSYEIC